MNAPPVMVPEICQKHQWLLLQQTHYKPQETWRALVVVANIALFQAATCDPETHKRIGGDVHRISEIGCLACYKPDAFGEIVAAAVNAGKKNDVGAIKALGERWVEASQT